MSTRRSIGSSLAPVPLRLLLGVTFVWLGLGKLLAQDPVSGDGAARLANIGVVMPGAPAAPGAGSTGPTPTAPHDPMPADGFQPPDATSPVDGPPEVTGPAAPAPSTTPATTPASSGVHYTAADFPNPTPVRRVYGLAIRLHASANPPPRADGTPTASLLPARLGQGRTPVILAYAVAAIEAGGGALVLMGLLTRVCAAALAVVLVGSIWLEQLGPAMNAGNTILGFLPAHGVFDQEAWMPLAWKVALLVIAMALVLWGPGAAAIDRVLFGRAGEAGHHDDGE